MVFRLGSRRSVPPPPEDDEGTRDTAPPAAGAGAGGDPSPGTATDGPPAPPAAPPAETPGPGPAPAASTTTRSATPARPGEGTAGPAPAPSPAQQSPLWSGIDPQAFPAPGWRQDIDAIAPSVAEIDRYLVQIFALVGEAIAGATHALLAGDREAAKQLVQRDEMVDSLTHRIAVIAQNRLVTGDTTVEERRELVAVLRMLPDLERNGDLAEHIARRAARGLGAEMSARSRGLVERMGEVATTIWRSTADAFGERSVAGAGYVDDLDDELDDLHVTLTAELVAGTMPLPVAIELAMVARFYERFGDHAVNLARRMAALVTGAPEPTAPGGD